MKRKFYTGERVKVKRYPGVPKKVHLRYGGKIGTIKGARYIKGRLWYKVSFGTSPYHMGEDIEEFTADELTRL